MSALVVEFKTPRGWKAMGRLEPGEQPGSMSSNSDGRREVIMFTCHGDYSIVQRSLAGVDFERGPLRGISTVGFETLARLADGETFEMAIQTDKMAEALDVRFRHTAA